MLSLIWIAYFKNKDSVNIVRQFDDEQQTQEHLFKEVLDRKDDLIVFSLVNTKTDRVYQVNLESGRIHIFNPGFIVQPESEVVGDNTQRFRLIYFRRVTQNMTWAGSSFEMNDTDIKYFLGYQYTDKNEKNVKRMIQITDNDEVYLV
jgi:hypothetical protein